MALSFPDGQDFLPPGAHEATVDEVKQGLVDAFPASRTRAPIYQDWLGLRNDIASILPIERQWLDGSFATRKLDPNDLDLATFVDPEAIEHLDTEREAQLNALTSGKSDAFGLCDSFLVVPYPPGHPLHEVSNSLIDGFSEVFFGSGAAGPGSKGFVEVAG